MKLSGIIPSAKDLEAIDSLEADLLRRRRNGRIGGLISLIGVVAQAVLLAAEKDYPRKLGTLFTSLYHLQFRGLIGPQGMPVPEFVGLLTIVFAFLIFFTLRWTSFLLREAEAPFQYTFWIEPFEEAGTPAINAAPNRILLLHHDLMERLNNRIKRLTLLDESAPGATSRVGALAKSHIHISGHYAVREDENKKWVLHVMPRIRIGPAGDSATLAQSIKYPLLGGTVFSADNYNQMIERAYSSIATEVYKQIERDVKGKMGLFPTPYLRAVAYFCEAEDFARSNTIDAYYHAIDLYREALRYFNLTKIKWLTNVILRLPLLWRLKVKSEHLRAKVQIGYAKCLIFRRQISALTGRTTEPLFEIRGTLKGVVPSLERLHRKMGGFTEQKRSKVFIAFLTFPKDSLSRYVSLRPLQPLFEKQRQILFDAYVVDALAHCELGSVKTAEDDLRDARAAEPQLSERNPLYLLAAAEVEPDLTKAILLFRQATEISPNFQSAQYSLARASQMLFRAQGELSEARARSVMDEYDKVLKINPGNIAALAAQGYLYWLVADPIDRKKRENLARAKKRFDEGCEIKAIVSETFTGELNYGLARIAAEQGRFNTSYDLFKLALESDPGIGAWSISATRRSVTSYYEYISSGMLERYAKFRSTVEAYAHGARPLNPEDGVVTDRIRKAVLSFTLNDYGNACLNYYSRLGSREKLAEASNVLTEATTANPGNAVAKYNRNTADVWIEPDDEDTIEATIKVLSEITEGIPTWRAAMIALTQAQVSGGGVSTLRKTIEENRKNLKREQQSARETEKKYKELDATLGNMIQERPGSLALILKPLPSQFPAAAISINQGVTQDDIGGLAREILILKKQEGQHRESAAAIIDTLEKAEGELGRRTREAMDKMAENTKLAPLFEELKPDYNGKGVDELLGNRTLRWDRLDENDVQALRAWAEILSYNDHSRTALEASIKICEHILDKYYPANFEVNLILERALKYLLALTKLDIAKSKTERARKAIKIASARAIVKLSLVLRSTRTRLLKSRGSHDGQPRLITEKTTFRHTLADWTEKINQVLKRTLKRRLKLCLLAKRQQANETIKLTVGRFIKEDPVHYFALGWHKTYFRHDQHREVIQRAIKTAGDDNEYRKNLVLDYEGKMVDLLEQGDYQNAELQYEITTDIAPRDLHYYSNLVSQWGSFKAPGHRREALQRTISALEQVYLLDPARRSDQELQRLDANLEMVEYFGEQSIVRQFGSPSISVIVGPSLIPYVYSETGELRTAVSDLTETIRFEVYYGMGVDLPEVAFRSDDLIDGNYVFLINDTRVATGRVREIKGGMFPGPSKALEVFGILGVRATNPETGDDARWVSEKDSATLAAAGYRVWNAGEYLLRHLGDVLRGKLAEFVGHQETLDLLDSAPRLAALHSQLESDPPGLTALTTVLRHLLNESVPIKEVAAIAQTFNALSTANRDLPSIIATSRLLPSVRPTLPGNNVGWSLYSLGKNLEDELGLALNKQGRQPVVAMELTRYWAVIGALRAQIGDIPRAALVVERSELRGFVKNVIAVEFPRTPVLSSAELLTGLSGKIAGEIKFEAPDTDMI